MNVKLLLNFRKLQYQYQMISYISLFVINQPLSKVNRLLMQKNRKRSDGNRMEGVRFEF